MQVQTVRRVRVPPGDGAARVRMRVLVVTPDADLRRGAARALESAGFEVLEASHSGHATLMSLTASRIDILASEFTSDDLPGPALAARLKRQHPGLQTVFFGPAGSAGSEGLLEQPFTQDQLLEAVTAAARAATSPAS